MTLARNAAASLPDDEDKEFSRTRHEVDGGDVVVKTEPRQLDCHREYRFRRTCDDRLVAPKSSTWHVIEYARQVRLIGYITPEYAEETGERVDEGEMYRPADERRRFPSHADNLVVEPDSLRAVWRRDE